MGKTFLGFLTTFFVFVDSVVFKLLHEKVVGTITER